MEVPLVPLLIFQKTLKYYMTIIYTFLCIADRFVAGGGVGVTATRSLWVGGYAWYLGVDMSRGLYVGTPRY